VNRRYLIFKIYNILVFQQFFQFLKLGSAKKKKNTKSLSTSLTQNLFEANLTIVGVKIWHDYKWGYHHNPLLIFTDFYYNLVLGYHNPIFVMPDFNPNNSRIYLKWVLGALCLILPDLLYQFSCFV
jgi:hypothetical protein